MSQHAEQIETYIEDHPGTGLWTIGQALQLPNCELWRTVEDLRHQGTITAIIDQAGLIWYYHTRSAPTHRSIGQSPPTRRKHDEHRGN